MCPGDVEEIASSVVPDQNASIVWELFQKKNYGGLWWHLFHPTTHEI